MARGTDVVVVGCESGQACLGEGMEWDARRSELVWVDTMRRLAHRARIGRGGRLKLVCTYHLPGRPGSITPVADEEGWIIALERGIHLLRPDGSTLELLVAAPAGARMKNAACDLRGRLWVGSMAEDQVTPIGALYRLEQDGGLEPVVDALVISSGIGWSPDGTTMYLADSGVRVVYSYPFDVERGTLGTRRVLLSFEEVDGTPDGLSVDGHGDVWIAMYGGHAIRRYAADGTLLAVLHVPAAQVTSCAFGGRGFRSLYITTATDGWDADQRAANPDGGLLYRVDTGAPGRPAQPFRPEPHWWARAAPAASSQAAGTGSGYEIVVAGGHGSMLQSALPEFEVTLVRGGRVHLVGNVIDQAALHAALHRLQDLHLDVLELHRLSDP
jgi:sugar lactone lactonase YvrE